MEKKYLYQEKKTKKTYRAIKGKDYKERKTLNQFSFVKDLGKGSFARVKLAIKGIEEEKFAIKIFNKKYLQRKLEIINDENGKKIYKDSYQDVMKEIEIMEDLYHPNVLQLHEYINDEKDENFYIVLDYAGNQIIDWDNEKNSFFVINKNLKYDENYIRKIMQDLVNGLQYIHEKGVIHRDIKPQNILEDEKGVIKLADFSVAHKCIPKENDLVSGSQGTFYFMSPECLNNQKKEGYSGKASDIWSLGVTLYCFKYLSIPFNDNSLNDLFKKIENDPIFFPPNIDISHQLKDLIIKMLNKNPDKRIKIKEIKKHPFLNSENDFYQ